MGVDISSGAALLRVKLIKSVPALQAHALHRLLAVEDELLGALCAVFPGRLSRYDSAVLVGSMIGGILAAVREVALDSDDPEVVRAALFHAIDVTSCGLAHFDAAAQLS